MRGAKFTVQYLLFVLKYFDNKMFFFFLLFVCFCLFVFRPSDPRNIPVLDASDYGGNWQIKVLER